MLAYTRKTRCIRLFNDLKNATAIAGVISAAVICLPQATLAAEALEGAMSERFDEIVVTSRKRSETMLDIPFSINVVSESTIEKLGADNYTDLLATVPSLTAYQNGPGRTRLSIRGVTNGGGNDNDTQNQETVGIYLDEIPISMGALNPELALFDLERVEVLRGPQGTLYGAGSMSGTIRLVSKKPNLNDVEGKGEATLSTTRKGGENYALKALVNVPVIQDKMAIRASGYYTHDGGYIDNVLTGAKDVNDGGAKGVKVAARLQVNENFTADLTFMHHDYSDDGRPEDLLRTPELSRDYPSADGYDDEMQIYNLGLTYDFGWAELVSSTSYFDRTVENRRSLDDLLNTLPVVPNALEDITDSEVFVQEVRLASTGDSAFQWTVGAYYDHKDVFYLNTFPVPGADAALGIDSGDFGAPTDFLFYGFDDLTVETYAFFGEAYYTWDKLTFTAGLRYFNWTQDILVYQSGLFNGEASAFPPRTAKADGINPKFNISYDIAEDMLVYAQAARGFRYGGTNGAIPESVCAAELEEVRRTGDDPGQFSPDKTWNYEVGAKGSTADNRLLFNAAYFHIKWKDMQTTRSFTCGFGFRENVGAATSQGVELELTARPIDGLTISVGGSYIDTTLDVDVPNLDALAGDPAPYVPKYSLNSTVEYSFPVTNTMGGYVWGNLQHIGDRGTEFSTNNALYQKMEDYQVVNLRAGLEFEHAEVSVFANNLFDSRGVVRALGRPPFDPQAAIRVQPRTIGVTVRGNF